MRTNVSWLDTEGGPFVVMRADQSAGWNGILDEGEGDSDFERACDVEDYIGVLPFDGGEALVLGDDPYPTAFLPAPTFGGVYLVRRLWGDDPREALAAVHEISPGEWTPEGVVFDVGDGDLILFDSVSPGEAPLRRVQVAVDPGRYAIETADVQPSENLCVMVHRLVPMN